MGYALGCSKAAVATSAAAQRRRMERVARAPSGCRTARRGTVAVVALVGERPEFSRQLDRIFLPRDLVVAPDLFPGKDVRSAERSLRKVHRSIRGDATLRGRTIGPDRDPDLLFAVGPQADDGFQHVGIVGGVAHLVPGTHHPVA